MTQRSYSEKMAAQADEPIPETPVSAFHEDVVRLRDNHYKMSEFVHNGRHFAATHDPSSPSDRYEDVEQALELMLRNAVITGKYVVRLPHGPDRTTKMTIYQETLVSFVRCYVGLSYILAKLIGRPGVEVRKLAQAHIYCTLKEYATMETLRSPIDFA